MATRNAWVLLFGGGVLLAAGFWGCGDDEETATSVGPGAGGSGGTGPVTGSGTMAMSSSTGMAAIPDIGLPCTTDANCQASDPEFRCLRAEDDSPVLGGGAPNGYCTKDCTNASECPIGSECILNQNGQGECMLECTIGPEMMFIDDEIPMNKCHQRVDTACTSYSGGTNNGKTVCVPVCGKDEQCGGRVCDPRSSLCQDTASTGRANNEFCDENAPDEDGCEGYCQPFTGGYAICAKRCSLGGQPIADQPDCFGIENGLCIYRPSGHGAGDWGACSPNCVAQDRCYNPEFWCRSTSYAPPGTGYCLGAQECPGGQADCNSLDPPQVAEYAWQCTDTPSGPFCLEVDTTNGNQLVFPLQGTTGAGGSGGTPGTGGGTGGAGGN